MAAYGSGAVARSIRDECTVMNVDVGGGTSKIAVCAEGKVIDIAAVDVGARLICLEPDGKIVRIEEAGRRYGQELGLDLKVGGMLTLEQGQAIAGLMADKLFETMRGGSPAAQGVSLLRTDPLTKAHAVAADSVLRRRVRIHLRQRAKKFGDLGPLLAAEIRARVAAFCRGSRTRSKASAPPWSAPRSTPSSSAAARSTSRRSTRCRCATCR